MTKHNEYKKLIFCTLIAFVFSTICLFFYTKGTLNNDINFHFLPAKLFGVPKDLAQKGISPLYTGEKETGWDGQFYYYIANDIFAQKDTAEHIDSNAYRYQRIGLPLTAKILSILTFQTWVNPTTYYLTSLLLILTTTFFGAYLFQKLNYSPFLILFWSLGIGTQLTMLNGLPDAAADSFLILAIIALYFNKIKTYTALITFAALSREAYIIFPLFFLLIEGVKQTFGDKKLFLQKTFIYLKSFKYLKHLTALIIFACWQFFIIQKFNVKPSEQAHNIMNIPLLGIYDVIKGGLTGTHILYHGEGLKELAKREVIGLILFTLTLILTFKLSLKLAINSFKHNFFNLSLSLPSLALVCLYFSFGSTVMMDYTGYMKAANLLYFLIPFLLILNNKPISRFLIVFFCILTIYFTGLLFFKTRVLPENLSYYTSPSSIEFSKIEPACLKNYNAKILPVEFEQKKTNKIFGTPPYIVSLNVTNTSNESFFPYNGKGSVNVSYHILNAENNLVLQDGIRSLLPKELKPNESVISKVILKMPRKKGSYLIRFTLVQEGCNWFYNANPESKFDIKYKIY